MGTQDQLQLERGATTKPRSRANVDTGIKTILFHVQNDKALDRTLETALSLARACEAHLSCLHITPIQAYVAFDSFGGVFVMSDVFKAMYPFVALQVLGLLMCIYFPGISLWLPRLTGFLE